ncbi:MAG: hypothetical protein DRI74_00670 [Bacteroidetes bacterium]|nr:MAG: hypothetical protein DRI74_00670 [Bacteroidota bacterium]
MARGIIDLIQENKRRFYAGEIRNNFYEESFDSDKERGGTVVVDNISTKKTQTSFWKNIKIYGQKFSDELFYETVK